MKKIILFVFTISIMLSACTSNTEKSNEPSYRTISEREDDSLTMTDTPVSERADMDAAEDDMTDNIDEYPGFTGIVSDYETPKCANLSINIKHVNRLCLICPDSENDAIYYVNYDKDNYIYQLKDGSSTLLLNMKADFLQLWNGELYFVGVNQDSSLSHIILSNIYKYNLETEELTLIWEAEITWLFLNSDGIYYTQIISIEEIKVIPSLQTGIWQQYTRNKL